MFGFKYPSQGKDIEKSMMPQTLENIAKVTPSGFHFRERKTGRHEIGNETKQMHCDENFQAFRLI